MLVHLNWLMLKLQTVMTNKYCILLFIRLGSEDFEDTFTYSGM